MSVRRRVRTTRGLAVPVGSALAGARPDAVLIPAIGAKMPGPLRDALKRREVMDAGRVFAAVV